MIRQTVAENPIQLGHSDFLILSQFIYKHYGIHLPASKKTLLESRLQKHLRTGGFSSFKKYIDHVCREEEHAALVNMINIVSTNKTDFFRERSHFDFMQSDILPEYPARDKEAGLKIWSAASSSGEEVYTIAMTMEEYMSRTKDKLRYSITGTDISTEVLNRGIEAIYSEDRLAGVPVELKRRYFLRSKDRRHPTVRVVKQLRDKARFMRFNLIHSRYPSRETYDMIFCRNVLIYFDKPTQEAVLNKLCHCLKKGGYLFLGHSESVFGMKLPLKQKIHTCYQKI